MSEHPIRSENELRCRSRYGVGCKTATDPWNGAVENSSARATDDQLPEESCLADVQRLQDIEPLAGADEPDSQTSASNKRQLVLFTSIFFAVCDNMLNTPAGSSIKTLSPLSTALAYHSSMKATGGK